LLSPKILGRYLKFGYARHGDVSVLPTSAVCRMSHHLRDFEPENVGYSSGRAPGNAAPSCNLVQLALIFIARRYIKVGRSQMFRRIHCGADGPSFAVPGGTCDMSIQEILSNVLSISNQLVVTAAIRCPLHATHVMARGERG
jgi:hypothetical protein